MRWDAGERVSWNSSLSEVAPQNYHKWVAFSARRGKILFRRALLWNFVCATYVTAYRVKSRRVLHTAEKNFVHFWIVHRLSATDSKVPLKVSYFPVVASSWLFANVLINMGGQYAWAKLTANWKTSVIPRNMLFLFAEVHVNGPTSTSILYSLRITG